jgi:hypothetical protein
MAKREVKVGVYDLGAESVELWLRPGGGAGFSTRSGSQEARGMAVIRCGSDTTWGEMVGNLLHEAKEFIQMRMGTRMVPDVDYARDQAGYAFFETHTQHSEACARVGHFLSECLPDLGRAWKQWKKGQ